MTCPGNKWKTALWKAHSKIKKEKIICVPWHSQILIFTAKNQLKRTSRLYTIFFFQVINLSLEFLVRFSLLNHN